MLWIFPCLSVLKGNLSRSLGAIPHGEYFPNALHVQSLQGNEYRISRHRTSLVVLKGKIEVGKQAILHSECFAIAHGVVDTVGSGAIALGL
jgi:hypothetical protein